MREHLKSFLDHLVVEKGVSRLTIAAYKRILGDFFKRLESSGISSLSAVDRPLIGEMMAMMRRSGKEASTIRGFFYCLRSFYGFLETERLIRVNPIAVMEAPKIERKLPQFLTALEMQAILAISNRDTPMGLFRAAVLEFLYATGCRVSELCNLEYANIDLKARSGTLIGKGDKERPFFFHKRCANTLSEYVERLRSKRPGSRYFFTGFKRKKRGHKPISARQIGRIVTEASKKAGITKRVSPHTIRHAFATHLLAGGADLRVCQELLGHSDISTTEIYTHVDLTALKKTHERFQGRVALN